MSGLYIQLEGYPEKIQLIADALEEAFPGLIDWVSSGHNTGSTTIKIEGYEIPFTSFQTQRKNAA